MKKRVHYAKLIPAYILILSCCLFVAFCGSRAATVIAENAPITERKCVVIDAGHGGEDGGATSCTGVLESGINLEIALRLEDLMHLLGIDTYMIRRIDRSVYTKGETISAKKVSDLKERVRIVNEMGDALLVSIHQNYFSDSRYSGAQVFYSESQESERLAKDMQSSLIQFLDIDNNRQAKKADGIYLMQNIDCVGVLVECGFLSNEEEEARLRSSEYQKKLVCVLSSVISNYLDH